MIAGGFLFVLEGLVVVYLGNPVAALSAGLFGSNWSMLGPYEALIGVLIVLFALSILDKPEHHAGLGVAAFVLVLASYVFSVGGGFYVGSVLAWGGAVSAFYWQPPKVGGAEQIRQSLGLTR